MTRLDPHEPSRWARLRCDLLGHRWRVDGNVLPLRAPVGQLRDRHPMTHEGMSPTADDEARAAWSEAARLKSALSQCGARAAETRRREVAVRLERDQLRTRLDDLEDVCRRLLAAYEVEEREDGFPFSFELRAAHRELQVLVGNSRSGADALHSSPEMQGDERGSAA